MISSSATLTPKRYSVYFEDQVIDFMAEILNMKARLISYDCMVPFKCYAAEKFERFNSR